ncbi:MAG: metal-dependent transcriptional regulator [Candidatus Ranarchaeia archaeon]
MPSPIIEEYLETLYELYEIGQPMKTQIISKRMNVAPATVTETLQKLRDYQYVRYRKYYGVNLTEQGYRIGRRIKRRHRLLEFFLYNVLGIAKENVHRLACDLEHSMNKELEDAICKTTNVPKHCPDDNKPIPACNKNITGCSECLTLSHTESSQIPENKKTLISLPELPPNIPAEIRFLHGKKTDIQQLVKKGITPGQKIDKVEYITENVSYLITGLGSNIRLSVDDAERVYVLPEKPVFG